MGAYRWTQRQIVTWSTERPRSAMISSRSRYAREYRRYHRTHTRMITSSKCRPRNSAGRLRVTLHRTRSPLTAFATEPAGGLGLKAHRIAEEMLESREREKDAEAVQYWR